MDEQFVFQGVHMLFAGGFGEKCWQEGEKRECRFVFIGRNLDKQRLKQGFESCVAEETLRFNVGDVVYARMRTWCKGRVMATWVEGNPYQIRLDCEEGETATMV